MASVSVWVWLTGGAEDSVCGAAELQEDCGIVRVEQEELAEDRLCHLWDTNAANETPL